MGSFLLQFLSGLMGAMFLFLLAAGLSLIFGVSRIINISHGAFYTLGAYLLVSFTRHGSLDLGGFLAVAVLGALQLFLSRSRTGRLIRAVADDREAAQLVGANHRHVFGVAAAIAFSTVALAGLAYAMSSQIAPTTGTGTLLSAFEAVVIGGIGSVWGTLVGGVVLGVAQQIGAQINPAYQILAGHLVFLAVLALRPQGLFGTRARA